MSGQSKPDASSAAPTRARAPGQAQKTLIGVHVDAATHGLPAPAISRALFPAEQPSEAARPQSRTARSALRRSGGEVREETVEVSLCETLPASESIVAALADVREPTHDVSLHELTVASPGIANDVSAHVEAAPAHHDASGEPPPSMHAPRGRSMRWLWTASALASLLAATCFILASRPPAPATIEVPGAPEHSASATTEPAPAPKVDTSDALPATQPSADTASEISGDQAAEAVEPKERGEPDAADQATLARADELAAQGSALRKRRMLGPSRAKYRAALQLRPGHPRALYGLVQLAMQQHDGEQAVQLALELVQAQPEQASYSLLLGDAYRAAGKRKEAREAWQNAARQGSALARRRLK